VILVDSNVPMYLVGAAHPNKEAARRLLEEAVAAGEALCTDAEVLQEILHRYTAIRRPQDIDPAFESLLAVVDVVYPIERADVERARTLIDRTPQLSARDAIHVAVMRRHDVDQVMSFDRGFDAIAGMERIGA
jgi:predicted nucleic acid-binding protein